MDRGYTPVQKARCKHLKDGAEETVSTTKFGCGQGGAGAHGLEGQGVSGRNVTGTCLCGHTHTHETGGEEGSYPRWPGPV